MKTLILLSLFSCASPPPKMANKPTDICYQEGTNYMVTGNAEWHEIWCYDFIFVGLGVSE